ncbi:MAG: hypothetical protein ACETWK_07870 [Candidatus Aminicenantaceae bacterium]
MSNIEKEREWLRWKKAPLDIEELRTNYFYMEEEGINQLRLDLQKIFNESRINISQIKYGYNMFEDERIKKVIATFDFSGSYFSLKKFIHTVEEFPKFLIVEKIDFLDTSTERDSLILRITMAGYYVF